MNTGPIPGRLQIEVKAALEQMFTQLDGFILNSFGRTEKSERDLKHTPTEASAKHQRAAMVITKMPSFINHH